MKIGNSVYNIPKSWNDITVKTFSDITKASTNTSKSQTSADLKVVEAITKIPYGVLLSLSKADYDSILTQLNFVYREVPKNNISSLVIGNKKYTVLSDLSKLTMGEMIDLEMILEDSAEADLLINILPIFVRESNDTTFDANGYNENKIYFSNNISIVDVLHIVDFF